MKVQEIWRFPVKSMQGERLDHADVEAHGIFGDRAFAVFDAESGMGLTARRAPDLLFASASFRDDGTVGITLPDGSVAQDDNALSEWLGRPVVLRAASDPGERVYENPSDYEHDADWGEFVGSGGAFHDSARFNVSFLSRATIDGWQLRRFRANVIVDAGGEDELVGSRVRIGSAELDVLDRIQRCVMVTRPQPDGADGVIDKDVDVLRTIHRERDKRLAVGATVLVPGRFAVGDSVDAAVVRTG